MIAENYFSQIGTIGDGTTDAYKARYRDNDNGRDFVEARRKDRKEALELIKDLVGSETCGIDESDFRRKRHPLAVVEHKTMADLLYQDIFAIRMLSLLDPKTDLENMIEKTIDCLWGHKVPFKEDFSIPLKNDPEYEKSARGFRRHPEAVCQALWIAEYMDGIAKALSDLIDDDYQKYFEEAAQRIRKTLSKRLEEELTDPKIHEYERKMLLLFNHLAVKNPPEQKSSRESLEIMNNKRSRLLSDIKLLEQKIELKLKDVAFKDRARREVAPLKKQIIDIEVDLADVEDEIASMQEETGDSSTVSDKPFSWKGLGLK